MTQTRVVNIKTGAPYDVYIGRDGKGQQGTFGNPIRVGATCPRCSRVHLIGDATLPCYRVYLLERLERDAWFREYFAGLRGKVLGCFCKPNPCHGDVIAEVLHNDPRSSR